MERGLEANADRASLASDARSTRDEGAAEPEGDARSDGRAAAPGQAAAEPRVEHPARRQEPEPRDRIRAARFAAQRAPARTRARSAQEQRRSPVARRCAALRVLGTFVLFGFAAVN